MASDQVEDMEDMKRDLATISNHWVEPDNSDDHVRSAISVMTSAVADYCSLVKGLRQGTQGGKKGTMSFQRPAIPQRCTD